MKNFQIQWVKIRQKYFDRFSNFKTLKKPVVIRLGLPSLIETVKPKKSLGLPLT